MKFELDKANPTKHGIYKLYDYSHKIYVGYWQYHLQEWYIGPLLDNSRKGSLIYLDKPTICDIVYWSEWEYTEE